MRGWTRRASGPPSRSIPFSVLLQRQLCQRAVRLTVDRTSISVSRDQFIAERQFGGRMVVTFDCASM